MIVAERAGAFRAKRPSVPVVAPLVAAFWSLPLLWLVGLEQVAWTPLAVVSLLLVLMRHGWARPSPIALFMIAFLAAMAASAFAIDEPDRLLSFLRVAYGYVGVLAILLILTHPRLSDRSRRTVLIAAVAAAGAAAAMALAAVGGLWRPSYVVPWGTSLPGALADSELVRRHVDRSLGGRSWIFGQPFFRPTGPFLFATGLGMALAVFAPLALGLAASSRGRRRWVAVAAAAAMVLALFATTGRTPLLALVASGALVGLLVRRTRRITIALGFAALFVGVVAVAAQPELLDRGLSFVTDARGSSTRDRLRVYAATIDLWFHQSPWIGFGTERDVPRVPFPAGSHSYPLGVLFRFGLVGAFALTGAVAVATYGAVRALRARPLGPFLAWSWFALLLASVTDAPDLDLLLLTLASVPVALVSRFGLRS